MSADPNSEVVLGAPVRRLIGDLVLSSQPGSVSNGAPPIELIANGAIDIDEVGRIVAVGSEQDLAPAVGAVERVGGLLMPGLVNAHAHSPMTLLRSVGDGLPLQRWLHEAIFPREGKLTAEDAWWGMALGSAEMLLAGVTTSCEMYWHEAAIVDAVHTTGARTVVTPAIISGLLPNGDINGWVAKALEFHADHHRPERRSHVGFAPHALYNVTPEHCGAIADAAKSVDAILHIHLEETTAERDEMAEKYGRSATQVLADAGVLEAKVLAAHGVWLSQSDMRLLGEAGASVAHCPQSNLKLGSGVAPTPAMLEAGVRVALGTDGPASNDDLDLWEEVKLAPLLARGVAHDPQAMNAATALDSATRSAGIAVGVEDIGHLSPGAWADMIRIDLDQPAFAGSDDLITRLVFAGSSRLVTDVWVAGRQVVADKSITTVDVAEAMAEVSTRAKRLAG